MTDQQREIVRLLEPCVYVAFIRSNEATQEVWCRDYLCIPLNSTASWWTDSDIIHVQVVFHVEVSGGSRCTPEVVYRTFSVDTVRNKVHYYDYKSFTDEYAWTFIRFNLNKYIRFKDGREEMQAQAAYHFCYDQLDKPSRKYGMLALACGGWDSKDESYFCSQYVVRMFQRVGELSNLRAWKTTPTDLYNELHNYMKSNRAVIYPHLTTWETKTVSFH